MLIKTILFAYAILAIFVSGGLFFQKKNLHYRLLSSFVLLLGLEMIYFLYATSPIRDLYPQFAGRYYFISGFFYGPLLWFHLQFSLKGKEKFNLKDTWHLLPIGLAIIYFTDILVLPDAERIAYIQQHFSDRIMPMNYARALSQLVYGVIILILVHGLSAALPPLKRIFYICLVSLYFLTSVLISWLTQFADSWNDFIVIYFVINTVVMLIAYMLYWQPDFLLELGEKYLNSGIPRKDMKRIQVKITSALADEQIFLDNQLNLKAFAAHIKENPHHISQTFSQLIRESFRDHVNRYRVEFAKVLLHKEELQHYTIEAIAQEAGFNNRVTFNKAFSKFARTKPSAYRNQGN
ncbi:MAG: helix-turn-helix domain-containing protein [Lewinella sp.]|uniref:helix-turn-helix domain-containing protein n=1 Tax=Lewinella sp. TaxID=2004506 RepID=UPI003D6BDB4B